MAKCKNIVLFGDDNNCNALLSESASWDYSFSVTDPNYYEVNSYWDRTPDIVPIPRNVAAVKLILEYLGPRKHIFYLSNEDSPNWGSLTKWVRQGNRAFCTGTICRTKAQNDAKQGKSFVPKQANKLPGKVFGTSTVVVVYSVDSDTDYGISKKVMRRLLKSCGRIVVRSRMSDIVSDKGFLAELRAYPALAKKVDVLISVGGMRKKGCNVRRSLSWEQMVEETVEELEAIDEVSSFNRVLVSFHGQGCLIYRTDSYDHRLVYRPQEFEGRCETIEKHIAFSTMAVLLASMVDAGVKPTMDELAQKVAGGLCAVRALLVKGFPVKVTGSKIQIKYPLGAIRKGIRLPRLECEKSGVMVVSIPRFVKRSLSIIHSLSEKSGKSMFDLARSYVREGPASLKDMGVPMLEFEGLRTFDRKEIEQLSNLHTLLESYVVSPSISLPLSICVFGTPGSGKSFAVREIAKSLGMNRKPLEFNLSQMDGYDDLAAAFHDIASEGLRGAAPLVFFDEFDSALHGEQFGWLKYLLAPMQDGVYRDGRSKYSLGRAVLVFAGGVCSAYEMFEERASSDEGRAAKAVDFASRVQAYINISGINSRDPRGDVPYLRRAILLRSLIKAKLGRAGYVLEDGSRLLLHERVLRAFLCANTFKHDARSMRAIVESSRLLPDRMFTPSCIENNCLDLHVSPDFADLLARK